MSRLELWKNKLEERLAALLQPFEPELLYQAMVYYPFLGGKRIRPLFLCAVCDALNGNLEDAITVGCAVELVHNYSLIHDDLPSLDNDDFRRGKPTCHRVFGEDMAILAGDALLTYAFEILSDRNLYTTLSNEDLLFLIKELASKAGFRGMVGGQVLDIKKLSNNSEISLKKTAQLFSFSFVAGGLIAKRRDLLPLLDGIGLQVGLLFQMADDYCDRDGFYQSYGDRILEKITSLHSSCLERLHHAGLTSSEMEGLFQTFLNLQP